MLEPCTDLIGIRNEIKLRESAPQKGRYVAVAEDNRLLSLAEDLLCALARLKPESPEPAQLALLAGWNDIKPPAVPT